MPSKRVLILGGTRDARALANILVGLDFDVTTSFAGVTDNPVLPRGKIRLGGFGGVEGLSAYLTSEKFDHVVDATHPYATQISQHAFKACTLTGTPLLRIEREAWVAEPDDRWIFALDALVARDLLPIGARVMLTVGRKQVSTFFERKDLGGVVRMIEAPDGQVPSLFALVLERPPYDLDGELALMRVHAIQYLLCKNSGGPRAAKLDAARQLGVPVIMLARPATAHMASVASVNAAVALLLGRTHATG